jgi:hypothetical protein
VRLARRAAVLAALAGAALLVLRSPSLEQGVLCLLPCLLLAVALLCERYPGERLITRIARRRRQPRRRPLRPFVPRRPAPDRPLAGRLMAAATAPRAPPLVRA